MLQKQKAVVLFTFCLPFSLESQRKQPPSPARPSNPRAAVAAPSKGKARAEVATKQFTIRQQQKCRLLTRIPWWPPCLLFMLLLPCHAANPSTNADTHLFAARASSVRVLYFWTKAHCSCLRRTVQGAYLFLQIHLMHLWCTSLSHLCIAASLPRAPAVPKPSPPSPLSISPITPPSLLVSSSYSISYPFM